MSQHEKKVKVQDVQKEIIVFWNENQGNKISSHMIEGLLTAINAKIVVSEHNSQGNGKEKSKKKQDKEA